MCRVARGTITFRSLNQKAMGLRLEAVVPWGRSLEEYIRMFKLTPEDMQGNILDCAGGPASFNAEMTSQGDRVISCDPVYQFSAVEIEQRIRDTYPIVMDGVRANYDAYIWTQISSPEQLGKVRMETMRQFLADFPGGLQQKRYQVAELPNLPFGDRQFDLALCAHFLFSYSDHLSIEFHRTAIQELCRVAREVRVFPLLTLSGDPAPALPVITEDLIEDRFDVEIQSVPYEFQKDGNQMLKIKTTLEDRELSKTE
jgi:hypothetical protein